MKTLQLLITHSGATVDATELLQSATWAGEMGQVGRTLDVELISPCSDPRQPSATLGLEDNVRFLVDGTLRFDGFVFSLQRDSGGDILSVGCADRGIYLKNNQGCYKFSNQTPEAITARVCKDFGVSTGALAGTGISITRNFPGVSLYQIIQTAYTLAGRKNGKKYMLRFAGDKLEVLEKKQGETTPVLRAGVNLLTATVSESAENLVSQVAIYSEGGTLLRTVKNDEAISMCGVMQRYLKQKKNENPEEEARQILDDNGVQRSITVTNLGNAALMSGDSIIATEPLTGLTGLYWISGDVHTWANGGAYTNKLTLDLRNLMDEAEAGTEKMK